MKTLSTPRLYIALIHHPVVNKGGDTIAAAVTNLDLHDIARAGKTYGVRRFYVVTPLADQRRLAESIVAHWVTGAGAAYNPLRRKAMELIAFTDSVETMLEEIAVETGARARTVVTSAKGGRKTVSFTALRKVLDRGSPHVLCLGTAWGLSEEFMDQSDCVLEPIAGNTDYNHLSVRSAAAIMLDRLLGGSPR